MADYSPPTPTVVVDPSWARSSPTLRPEGLRRVVSGAHLQESLRRHLDEAPTRLVMAQLVRAPGNPQHAGSVAVFVGRDHVGDLPRADLGQDSQALYDALDRLADRGIPATCWAKIEGGSSDEPSLSLSLFTGFRSDPDFAFPFLLTVPPEQTAQVLGVEAHGAFLERLLDGRNGMHTSLELVVVDGQPELNGEAGPQLHARVDGLVIGALSVAESAPRLEIVRCLVESGRSAHAMGSIRRSPQTVGGFIVTVSTVVVPGPGGLPLPQWKRRLANPE